MNERRPIKKNNPQKPANSSKAKEGDVKKPSGKGKKATKWAILSVLFIVLLIVVGCLTIYYILYDGIPFVERIEPYVRPAFPDEDDFSVDYDISTDENTVLKTPIFLEKPIDENIINILLVGCDSADGGSSRSDTMMMLSYDKRSGRIVLNSFLRDSFVPIKDHNWNRLNATYTYGGVGLTINTINEVYGLDIQYFVSVDFEGFESIIDSIGGVTLTITEAEAKYLNKYSHAEVSAGEVKLDGATALEYARIRTGIIASEGGDFNRTYRQRKVITSVINQALNAENKEVLSLLKTCLNYVRTNLGAKTIIDLASDFLDMNNFDITGYPIPAEGTWKYDEFGKMSIIKITDEGFDENIEILRQRIYG